MVRILRLSLLLVLAACPAWSVAQSTVAVQFLFSALNQERTSRRLSALHLDDALTQAAAAHASMMADRGELSHQFPGEPGLSERAAAAGARFQRIAENVAEGPSVTELQDAWMHSAGHRANILDPAVDAVGIAVVERQGVFYAVEDFGRVVARLTPEQQEASVAMLLDQAGLELLPSADARKSCQMSSGYAGKEQPSFVMRYTTIDLSRLPGQLQAHLAKRQEHRAAVGACEDPHGSNFTNYRIAVLLYP